MKKYIHYILYIVFAVSMLYMGALGKLTGAEKAIGLFTKINLLGLGESFGRYLVGSVELVAGILIFFKKTRKCAAALGIIVMLGALYFHTTMIGFASAGPAIVTLIIAIYFFAITKRPFAKK